MIRQYQYRIETNDQYVSDFETIEAMETDSACRDCTRIALKIEARKTCVHLYSTLQGHRLCRVAICYPNGTWQRLGTIETF